MPDYLPPILRIVNLKIKCFFSFLGDNVYVLSKGWSSPFKHALKNVLLKLLYTRTCTTQIFVINCKSVLRKINIRIRNLLFKKRE